MSRLTKIILINALILGFSLAILNQNSLSKPDSPDKEELFKIVVTSSVVENLAKEIVDDTTEVKIILPNGVEPHDFEPTPQDVINLNEADIVLAIGNGFEPWLSSYHDSNPSTKIIYLAEELKKNSKFSNVIKAYDPHIWLDPAIAIGILDLIADSIDSIQADKYQNLRLNLVELNSKFSNTLSHCSLNEYISLHGAFNYMLSKYGIEGFNLTGINAEEEINIKSIKSIIDVAKNNSIKVIFTESALPPKVFTNLTEEIDANISQVDPLEIKKEAYNQDYYIKTMSQNLINIADALKCIPNYAIK